jgi:HAD superfamily phosphatase (TIGR01668 family)
MLTRVDDVSEAMLARWNIQGVALDLDNTIVPWHTTEISEAIHTWVDRVRARNIRICLLTNNYLPHVRAVGAALGVPVVRGVLKPWRGAYAAALRELGTEPARTLAIGDQLFTDVLGAKAAGMKAVVVQPLSRREFFTTKLLRMFERPVYACLRRGVANG